MAHANLTSAAEPSLSIELQVALDAAERAAARVAAIYETAFEVAFKDEHGDPVTAADKEANALLLDALRKAFPTDTIVAEESEVPADFHRAHRCWFVDPLDGTREFVSRLDEFSVMVGLAVDGEPQLGVVVVPAMRALGKQAVGYTAFGERGRGAWLRSSEGVFALQPSVGEDAKLERLIVSRSLRSQRLAAGLAQLGVSELRCGSVGVKVARLLAGEASAYFHPASRGGPKLWDLCAPHALAVAAGFLFTNEKGEAIRYDSGAVEHHGGLIAAPSPLAKLLVDVLGRV